MNRFLLISLACMRIAFISNPMNAQQTQPQPSVENDKNGLPWNVQREFMLVKMDEFTRNQLIEAQAEIDLTVVPQAGIYMEGDSVYIPVKIYPEGRIKFYPPYQNSNNTSNISLKKAVFRQLKQINRYKTEGHFLLLYSNKKPIIKAIAKDWD